ncbi:MAG: DmpA family aminopeptidase [Bacillota bacterium]
MRARARDCGVVIGRLETGPLNAITDVPGVLVGQTTVIAGDGPLVPGHGPARTGVTAIRPHPGNLFHDKVAGAAFVLNGFGKTIGLPQVAELGTIETPIVLTNTLNVGLCADALVEYMLSADPGIGVTAGTVNPVVGECNDGYLNDIRGRHVKAEHVLAALRGAATGPVQEGSVGAGTGMSCFGWKGGVGTASRRAGAYTLGVLVVTNFGRPHELTIDGVHVGRELTPPGALETPRGAEPPPPSDAPAGSIMIVVGTDAPVDSRQLGRLCRRAAFGLANTGSTIGHGSGDFILAFTSGTREPADGGEVIERTVLRDDGRTMTGLFVAAVEATEEAIIDSLFTAETVTGRDGHRREALPIPDVIRIMDGPGRPPRPGR